MTDRPSKAALAAADAVLELPHSATKSSIAHEIDRAYSASQYVVVGCDTCQFGAATFVKHCRDTLCDKPRGYDFPGWRPKKDEPTITAMDAAQKFYQSVRWMAVHEFDGGFSPAGPYAIKDIATLLDSYAASQKPAMQVSAFNQSKIPASTLRREFLGKNMPKCHSCDDEQVQLTDHFNVPAEWKCRKCGHRFDYEPSVAQASSEVAELVQRVKKYTLSAPCWTKISTGTLHTLVTHMEAQAAENETLHALLEAVRAGDEVVHKELDKKRNALIETQAENARLRVAMSAALDQQREAANRLGYEGCGFGTAGDVVDMLENARRELAEARAALLDANDTWPATTRRNEWREKHATTITAAQEAQS